MTRILLIAAMLLPVASVMAAAPLVTITADVNVAQHMHDGVAHKTVTIGYSGSVAVRAFALDINVDGGMNIGDNPVTDYKTGESKVPAQGGTLGYGIFPGRFRDFVNPSNPDPCWSNPNYNPLTPWNSPGAENTGLGWNKIVAELGTLYSEDTNKPLLTGTLFTFDVNSEGGSDCNLTVAVNALRGGIVGTDANPITDTNLPFTKKIVFAAPCTVPNCVGLTRDQCLALLAGTTPPQTAVDHNVQGTGQVVRTVIAQIPAAAAECTGTVDINVVSWPVKPLAKLPGGADGSLYANWIARGRPACWAYPRQCRGDVDGKIQGLYWVASSDLNYWKSANQKTVANLPSIPGGICADFDHKIQGLYWVASSDLNIWKSFNQKTVANVPVCGTAGDVNYWYLCAPGGVCPNEP